jgi:hypothetical protein
VTAAFRFVRVFDHRWISQRNYLVMKLKVNGKPLLSPEVSIKDAKTDGSALPEDAKTGITVSVDGDVVSVSASSGGLSKRYLKYLSKRYIASIGGREFLRIVATTKDSYTIKQIRTEQEEEEEEEEDV